MPYLFETDEHAAIRQIARRFAATHIAPRGAEWEEAEEFPIELYRQAAASGVTGIGYPARAATSPTSWSRATS